MKIVHISLFKKFAFVATMVVIIFSIINLVILWQSGYKSFEKEIDKHSKVISRIIAENAIQPIIYDDYVSVYRVIDQIKSNDSSIAYLFILDTDNKIISQSYNVKIPLALINANKTIDGHHQIKDIETLNFPYKKIRDIAYPLLEGELGTIRIGLIEDDIRKELYSVSRKIILMVLIFFILGLVGAFFFSFLVTMPIKRISRKAQSLDFSSIDQLEIDDKPMKFKTYFNYYISDEMDILTTKFSEMVDRLKANKKELQSTRDSFIQAEKMASIGTLTAGISHEINNPLAGIKNCISRMEREPKNTEQNLKYLELIKDATNKMEGILNPLLSFSRKTELKYSESSLDVLINNALQLTDYRIKKSKIEVIADLDPQIKIIVSQNQFVQVLINLIINGIDAIDEKKSSEGSFQGRLIFSVETTEYEIKIKLKDNGIGIPIAKQHKIFDPFYTTKEQGKGTGLGLYVSYNMIKDMGGTLSLFSQLGSGTEFIITLNI